MASLGSSSGGPKHSRILACVLCQHRKIKCDRVFPCSNCTKANIKCTPSTPAPVRKRKRPNQDLQERLARCEALLKEYAREKPDGLSPRRSSSEHGDGFQSWQCTGKLVEVEGGVRFMDNVLFGSIAGELQAMREIMDADEHEDVQPDSQTPDDHSDFILGSETAGQKLEDFWPDATTVFRLWQVYVEKVNPLTKIIHVPTLQPLVAEAIGGSQKVPKNVEALLFAIFTMAACSLTSEECRTMLCCSKDEAIRKYSCATRISLMRLEFLKTNDMTTLQALVVYSVGLPRHAWRLCVRLGIDHGQKSLQGRYDRHAAWVLNGVVIRIAQKIGLHRDGEKLGLGPFDTEMRRRLWWQIMLLDARTAMLSGLNHSLLPRHWDTLEPRNLNDADMYPSATEPFQDREGPTEMVFCIIIHRLAKHIMENPGLENAIIAFELGQGPGVYSPEQVAKSRKLIEDLSEDLKELLNKYSDPTAGPVHEMAVDLKDFVIWKLTGLSLASEDDGKGGGEMRTTADKTFGLAVLALEHDDQTWIRAKERGFLWFALLHFQIDIFMYLAGQLCYRTEGELVDRAWQRVGHVFSHHPSLLEINSKTNHTIAVFLTRAWVKREELLMRRTGQIPEVPWFIDTLRAGLPHEENKSDRTPPAAIPPPMALTAHAQMDGQNALMFDPLFLDGTLSDWDIFGGLPSDGAGQMPVFPSFTLGQTPGWLM